MKIEIGSNAARLGLTAISAAVCGYWMYHTKGASGVGWFVFSLFLIWNDG